MDQLDIRIEDVRRQDRGIEEVVLQIAVGTDRRIVASDLDQRRAAVGELYPAIDGLQEVRRGRQCLAREALVEAGGEEIVDLLDLGAGRALRRRRRGALGPKVQGTLRHLPQDADPAQRIGGEDRRRRRRIAEQFGVDGIGRWQLRLRVGLAACGRRGQRYRRILGRVIGRDVERPQRAVGGERRQRAPKRRHGLGRPQIGVLGRGNCRAPRSRPAGRPGPRPKY